MEELLNLIKQGNVTASIDYIKVNQLTILNLSNKNIETEEAVVLAQVLPHTMLTTLLLEGNPIGNEGAFALAEVLPQTMLTILDLGNTNLRVQGVVVLAQALPDTKLTKLYLYWNDIGNDGVLALAEVLPQTMLSTLQLQWSKISPKGAVVLAQALPQTMLIKLYLKGNPIGNEGAFALAEALPHTQIVILDLPYNNIGDKGALALAEAAPQTMLTILNLACNNKLTRERIKMIQAIVDKNLKCFKEMLNELSSYIQEPEEGADSTERFNFNLEAKDLSKIIKYLAHIKSHSSGTIICIKLYNLSLCRQKLDSIEDIEKFLGNVQRELGDFLGRSTAFTEGEVQTVEDIAKNIDQLAYANLIRKCYDSGLKSFAESLLLHRENYSDARNQLAEIMSDLGIPISDQSFLDSFKNYFKLPESEDQNSTVGQEVLDSGVLTYQDTQISGSNAEYTYEIEGPVAMV